MNESFVFYKDWSDTIEMFDEQGAKDLLYKIYLIGINREEEAFNSVVNPFEKSFLNRVKGDIDRAKARYIKTVLNGKKGGRPPYDLDIDEILTLQSNGFTYEQIGQYMGVSKNTIADRIRKYKTNKNQNIETLPNTDTTISLKEEDKVKDNEEVEE